MSLNIDSGVPCGTSEDTLTKVKHKVQEEHGDIQGVTFDSECRHSAKFSQLSPKEYMGKRVFDCFVGIAGFVVLTLLYPFVALLIKASSKGPVFFKQQRTGRNGEEFTCFKFRTMHQLEIRSPGEKPVVTNESDRRIFSFGKVLRKTNLDELPQIINVLKGEMSIVGPRPYAVKECGYWNETFDDHFYRYSVKPGITGYAQILGYRGGTLNKESMRTRLDKDLVYVQKQSLGFDLRVVYQTIKQMLHLNTNAH